MLACLGLYFFQTRLLYHPRHVDFSNCGEAKLENAVAITTSYNGTPIRVYLRKEEGAKSWVIFFHGNAGSACRRLWYRQFFGKTALNMAAVEYPGFGGDTSEINQENLLQVSLASFDYVQSLNLNKLPLFVHAESLGTGIGTYIASKREMTGLILQSPYDSIESVAKKKYWGFPVGWILKDKYPAYSWAENVKAPTLIFHCEHDTVIPYDNGKEESRHFKNLKELVTLIHSDHSTWQKNDKEVVTQKIETFLSSFYH